MLAEHQVVHLLDEAERTVGKRLDGVRGQLKSEAHVRPAIWELIVIDSMRQIGRVEYERETDSGRTPDLYVETGQGALWVEAAFLLPRFADVESRQMDFRRAVRAEERRIGINLGSIHEEFYGQAAPYGFEMTLPAQHEIATFFRRDCVTGFFNAIQAQPDLPLIIDLGEHGATVRLGYVPAARASGSSSVVIEQPREVGEHAVYRLLAKKAKKYHARDLGAPLIVCIGSERSRAVRATGPMSVSSEEAVREACRRYPVLSGVIIVSIEDTIPSFGSFNTSRRANVSFATNRSATFPLDDVFLLGLNIRFDLIDYGHGWNEWEGVRSVADRQSRLGGSLLWEAKSEGYSITLPAHDVLRLLGGGWRVTDLQKNYRMTDSQNPFRKALQDGRAIVGVELVPSDPRRHEPQMMRVTFGPTTPLLLQSPKG